jgi:uncharacterized membrane protein YfcA
MEILLLIACGLIAGLLGGMIGIGGGMITVPTLYFIFHHSGLFESHVMQVAASTSLAISFFISLFSSLVQHSKKAILFSAFKWVAPGLIIGCASGAILAHFISSELIRWIFGIGAFLIGIYFAIPRLPHLHISAAPNKTLSFFGLIIGISSSLLGIGGGILAFPTFLAYNMDIKSASATSSCTTTISSLIGTITYLLIAWRDPSLPHTFGYIQVPALLTIGLSAMITTPLGVKLSHTLNVKLIKQIFGICVCLIGLTMIFL